MPRLSQVLIIVVMLSLVANIALAQNYTHSLILEANDGIGISNFVAELIIIGDSWSIESFKTYFENSIVVTLLWIVLLIISMVFRKSKRNYSYYG